MNWEKLTDISQIEAIKRSSNDTAVLIFKHSTRCSISATALGRLERNWKENNSIKPFFLDLLSNRTISNQIAEEFKVEHQSPQALVIKNGKCVYDASHMEISFDAIAQYA